MGPIINLRIKTPDVAIPMLRIEFDVRTIEYSSSTERCYVVRHIEMQKKVTRHMEMKEDPSKRSVACNVQNIVNLD